MRNDERNHQYPLFSQRWCDIGHKTILSLESANIPFFTSQQPLAVVQFELKWKSGAERRKEREGQGMSGKMAIDRSGCNGHCWSKMNNLQVSLGVYSSSRISRMEIQQNTYSNRIVVSLPASKNQLTLFFSF